MHKHKHSKRKRGRKGIGHILIVSPLCPFGQFLANLPHSHSDCGQSRSVVSSSMLLPFFWIFDWPFFPSFFHPSFLDHHCKVLLPSGWLLVGLLVGWMPGEIWICFFCCCCCCQVPRPGSSSSSSTLQLYDCQLFTSPHIPPHTFHCSFCFPISERERGPFFSNNNRSSSSASYRHELSLLAAGAGNGLVLFSPVNCELFFPFFLFFLLFLHFSTRRFIIEWMHFYYFCCFLLVDDVDVDDDDGDGSGSLG